MVTDEANYYSQLKRLYHHAKVNHANDEWVVGDWHTNTVEGFFSIFKRGVKGIYQHVSEKHLHRYLAEYDFRYSNRSKLGYDDAARRDKALCQIEGRRLTYRRIGGARSNARGEEAPPF